MPRPSTKHKFELRIIFRIVIILLVFIFAVYLVIYNSSASGKLGFKNFRAEGLSLHQAAPSGIKYFKKYYNILPTDLRNNRQRLKKSEAEEG